MAVIQGTILANDGPSHQADSIVPIPAQLDAITPDGNMLPSTNADVEASTPPTQEYSTFPLPVKGWIISMVTISSFVSPVTVNIYFPALVPLARDLNVSTNLINLTLTAYQIFQGLAPSIFGDLGDMAGRRPAFILAFVIYIGASVGLVLQTDYAALMVLRCLQSVGSSGTLALGYAVVADLTITAERGWYMGIVGVGIMAGPGIGPVLGGVLAEYLTWRAIFWFCLIIAAVWFIPYVLFVPETSRKVVGNGLIPPRGWNMTLIEYLRSGRERKERAGQQKETKLYWPNPLRTLTICLQKDMSLILLLNAIAFNGVNTSLAILSTSFSRIYGLNELQIGLCYLPYGIACCIAVVVQGRVLDWNYRRIARNIGFTINRTGGDDLRHYPIERARLQVALPLTLVGILALVGYGWTLYARTSLAGPLVMQFIIGLCLSGGYNIMNVLIVDLYPQAPATAIAANNLVRCLLGAVGTAVIERMINSMGYGWCFTVNAALIVMFLPGLYFIVTRGPAWREERRIRAEEQHKKREAITTEIVDPTGTT